MHSPVGMAVKVVLAVVAPRWRRFQFGGLFQWRYPADYLRRYLYRQDLHTDFQRLQCRQGYVCPGTLISMFYVGFMVRLIAPHLG